MPDLRTAEELEREWILRLRAHSPAVTWFGPLGLIRGVAKATAALTYGAHRLYAALLARGLLSEATGDALTELSPSFGAQRDETGVRAAVLAIPLPVTSPVSDITGLDVEIPLGDGARYDVGMSVKLRNGDGTVSEGRTIGAIGSGTGPNGGDVLTLSALTGSYSPSTEDVAVVAQIEVPTRTVIESSEGVSFETLDTITTGAANAVLVGALPPLSLATKVWAEAQVFGEIGNIAPDTLIDTETPIRGIDRWYNPEAGRYGADVEEDADLRVRAAVGPSARNQETLSWLLALAQQGNRDVARAFLAPSTSVGTIQAKLLKRNGSTFSNAEFAALEAYMEDRVRSYMRVSLINVTQTAVEVDAVITLASGYTLRDVYLSASARLAAYLDWRSWAGGEDVDEAALLALVRTTPGVAGLETSSFLPAADVAVATDSVPTLARLSLKNSQTGETINATLSQSF